MGPVWSSGFSHGPGCPRQTGGTGGQLLQTLQLRVSARVLSETLCHLHSTSEEGIMKVLVKKRRVQLGLKRLKIDEKWHL